MRVMNTNNLSMRRVGQLHKALKDSATLREFLQRNGRDETELLFLLTAESERGTVYADERPRRSMLKRLHSAYCTARRENEWAELESRL